MKVLELVKKIKEISSKILKNETLDKVKPDQLHSENEKEPLNNKSEALAPISAITNPNEAEILINPGELLHEKLLNKNKLQKEGKNNLKSQ